MRFCLKTACLFFFISSVLSNFVAPACARSFRLSLNIERLRNRTETLLNVIEFYETCITLWAICCWCCRCYVPFIMFFCYCHLLLLSHIWTALSVCVCLCRKFNYVPNGIKHFFVCVCAGLIWICLLRANTVEILWAHKNDREKPNQTHRTETAHKY